MASVSHLPHVLANVLVAQAARVLAAEGERLPATGPIFRDVTRVAGANSPIWRDIYLANADALVAAIDDTGRAARRRARACSRPATTTASASGTTPRATTAGGCWRPTSPAARCTSCACSVPNRPGIVAEIALALGRATIDIVDMGLYPSADDTHGTIALWIAGAATRRPGRAARSRGLGFTVARA